MHSFLFLLQMSESRNIKDVVVVGVESYQIYNPHYHVDCTETFAKGQSQF